MGNEYGERVGGEMKKGRDGRKEGKEEKGWEEKSCQ